MKTIHRRLTILIAAAALSLGAITTLLLVGARGPADPASSTSVQALYTIGQYEGQVAVFLAGLSRPDQVFDVYVASLPAEEQERLHQGIPVYDDKELQRLLEDYTS